MTTEQPYTPDVEQIEADWKAYMTTTDPDNYYDAITEEEAQARWDRAIAQVRRDAAREALTAHASDERIRSTRIGDQNRALGRLRSADAAEAFRDRNYPEETS